MLDTKDLSLRTFTSAPERRKKIEEIKKVKLENIGKSLPDSESDIFCENNIGGISIPLGVAGPFIIANKINKKNIFIPLATTEGGLVASVNRGFKALESELFVEVDKVGTTRGPVFYTGSVKKGKDFCKWLKKNESKIKKIAESDSKHTKLEKIDIRLVSTYVFLRLYFNTEDAMGMNMATFATENIAQFIEKETGVSCLSIAGNFDIDKKPAWVNFINNRGMKVWAETVISKKTVEKVLKTSSNKLYETWLAKCMIGSAMSGSLGFNAHYANIVAAFFAATGQDLAHVVEGSMGITIARVLENEDLYFSVYLPAVMIGTIGGGTGLLTQTEARKITGATNSEELAEILGAGVLAGELSLLASLSEGSLSRAHRKLGRKK